MKKYLFILIFTMLSVAGANALTADWRIHTPFDNYPYAVVETPGRVYFMGRTFQYSPTLKGRDFQSLALHYYDKQGDEIRPVNSQTIGSDNIVSCIAYNQEKKYLLVVYTNCNIDFIYDDGRVENIPVLKASTVPGKKEVNSISFDNDNNLVYLATSFGYVALSEKKYEIAESRNYGKNVSSVARCGNNMVLVSEGIVYYAPYSEQRFNITGYNILAGAPAISLIFPVDGGFLGIQPGEAGYVYSFKPSGSSYSYNLVLEDPNLDFFQTYPDGYLAVGSSDVITFEKTGKISKTPIGSDLQNRPIGTRDNVTFWVLNARYGLRAVKRDQQGEWTSVKQSMRPNAPATYISTSMEYHPNYGMLVGSNGYDLAFPEFSQFTRDNVSGLKDSFWTEFSPTYRNLSALKSIVNYSGLAVDPSNKNYVYRGSFSNGLLRINLNNPDDVLIVGNPSSANKTSPYFVADVPDQKIWDILCRFANPQFTPDGTFWALYNNADTERAELKYWSAADRMEIKSPETYRPLKTIVMPKEQPSSNVDVMLMLKTAQNKNLSVIAGGIQNDGTLIIYDHNATPEVTSDDKYVYVAHPYDQDGGSVTFLGINDLFEDPETGLVWILSQRGVFTFNPRTIFENPRQVNRIKVSRNDGTNLADYLLNEVNVNHLSIDGEGRKWFSTSNGLVCTSKDGKVILGEFSTDNSELPDDNVFRTCYNPSNNSLMVATGSGLVEMFPSGGGNSTSTANEARIYPNPVEPDFYGWVKIDNVADGSLVKITDAQGGIVKELGPVYGGSVEWDVSGLNNSRVSTGVYYVLVSPGSGGGNTSVSKILVLN